MVHQPPQVIIEMRQVGEDTKPRFLGPFGSEGLARDHARDHLRGYAWTVHELHSLVQIMPTVRTGQRREELARPAARSISVGSSVNAHLTRAAETPEGDDIVDAEVVDP